MSGPTVRQSLRDRFDAIRAAELQRLDKKLRGLTDADRRSVEAIAADVVVAIARAPEDELGADASPATLEALVRLFALS